MTVVRNIHKLPRMYNSVGKQTWCNKVPMENIPFSFKLFNRFLGITGFQLLAYVLIDDDDGYNDEYDDDDDDYDDDDDDDDDDKHITLILTK